MQEISDLDDDIVAL